MRGLVHGLAGVGLALASPCLADSPGPVPQGKLSDAVVPSAYRLDLTLDPDRPRFTGHVEIDARLAAPTRFIYLHGRDLAVHQARAMVSGQMVVANWRQVDPSGVALLTFATPLPAGTVTLAFDYDAPLNDGPEGLFRVQVGGKWYVWSQFESTDARAAYPSFDQPGFKQPFTVTLRTPPGTMAINNAPETGVDHGGAQDVHHFAATPPLPTYLLALMVGPFATVETSVPANAYRAQPLPMRIVAEHTNAADLGFARDNAPKIVGLLEDYFGQDFPYPKLDLITTPILPGAMENAGADLFADPIIVLKPHPPVSQQREFGMVVSHELAHQWFGDLVTPAWWDDIWLNESFANWMGYRIGDAWRPDLHIADGALAEGFEAMATDALVAGRPIHQQIDRTAQIDAAFDGITYGKGGQVVAMIAGFMGDAKFRDGVRAYMAAHRYGNATSADFFKAMADVAGDPRILPAMQSFTDQQGVPLLTFEIKRDRDGTLRFSDGQSRYTRLGTTAPATKWIVPLCYRIGADRSCALDDPDHPAASAAGSTSGAMAASPVFMPNASGTGYYRFEFSDGKEWDRLIAASAELSGGEWLAVADSLLASFQAGRAPASQLVALAKVMSANPDSHAAAAALQPLGYLADRMVDPPAKEAAHGFLRGLLGPQLTRLGFDPAAGAYASDDPERSQRRADIVAALDGAKDPSVHATLLGAAKAYLQGNTQALDPAWLGAGFGAVLHDGGLPAAKALFGMALASDEPLFRPAALDAIASSGQPEIATWLLNTQDERLRLSERLDMIGAIAATDETRDLGYAWIHAHLADLLKGGAGIFFSARLPRVFGGYCAAEKADAIARDFGPELAGKTGELELARVLERIRACARLKAARGAEATAALAMLR